MGLAQVQLPVGLVGLQTHSIGGVGVITKPILLAGGYPPDPEHVIGVDTQQQVGPPYRHSYECVPGGSSPRGPRAWCSVLSGDTHPLDDLHLPHWDA